MVIGGEEDPEKLADLAQRRLRGKIPQLRQTLQGRVAEHHRFLLRLLLDHLEFFENRGFRLWNPDRRRQRPKGGE